MRNFLISGLLLFSTTTFGQLTANILVPPSGMVDKQQLWNMVLSNTELAPLQVQIQISFSEVASGQPIFTAATGIINIQPGSSQLTATTLGFINYNVVNNDYRIDPGPSGLLPIGNFLVCYNIQIDKPAKVIQHCQQLTIPPLGPLLLSLPANKSSLTEFHPLLSWIPPSPSQTLRNLQYNLVLTELLAGQTAVDAIQQNVPLHQASNLSSMQYLYNQSAPALQAGKQYAWQVTAYNNQVEISKSEAWSFACGSDPFSGPVPTADPVYWKLNKNGLAEGFAICWDVLRLDYFNETMDTTMTIQVQDLTETGKGSFQLELTSFRLRRGSNLITYKADTDKRFINKHEYLLRLTNSRGEPWQLKFEFRKKD